MIAQLITVSAVLAFLALGITWYIGYRRRWLDRMVRDCGEAQAPLQQEIAKSALAKINEELPPLEEQRDDLQREHDALKVMTVPASVPTPLTVSLDRVVAVVAGATDMVLQPTLYLARTTLSVPTCIGLGVGTAVGLGLVGGVGVVKSFYREGGEVRFRRNSDFVMAAVAVPAVAAFGTFLLARVADASVAAMLAQYETAIAFTLAESVGVLAGVAEARYRIATHGTRATKQQSKSRRRVSRLLRGVSAKVEKLITARAFFQSVLTACVAAVLLAGCADQTRGVAQAHVAAAVQEAAAGDVVPPTASVTNEPGNGCRIALDLTPSVDSAARREAITSFADALTDVIPMVGCTTLMIGSVVARDTVFVRWRGIPLPPVPSAAACTRGDGANGARGEMFSGIRAFADARRAALTQCEDSVSRVFAEKLANARRAFLAVYDSLALSPPPRASAVVAALVYLTNHPEAFSALLSDMEDTKASPQPGVRTRTVVVLLPSSDNDPEQQEAEAASAAAKFSRGVDAVMYPFTQLQTPGAWGGVVERMVGGARARGQTVATVSGTSKKLR